MEAEEKRELASIGGQKILDFSIQWQRAEKQEIIFSILYQMLAIK